MLFYFFLIENISRFHTTGTNFQKEVCSNAACKFVSLADIISLPDKLVAGLAYEFSRLRSRFGKPLIFLSILFNNKYKNLPPIDIIDISKSESKKQHSLFFFLRINLQLNLFSSQDI